MSNTKSPTPVLGERWYRVMPGTSPLSLDFQGANLALLLTGCITQGQGLSFPVPRIHYPPNGLF